MRGRSLPIAAASILQQLFSSADLAVVGRFDSAEAMAAVGSNAALVNLLVSLFMGLSIGGNVTVASLIGRGEKARVHEAVPSPWQAARSCSFWESSLPRPCFA